MSKQMLELSERLLQLASDEGTAQIHDVALQIAAAAQRLSTESEPIAWQQSDETIRNMIAREIWRYQECEEAYGPFDDNADETKQLDVGMRSLIKQTAIDQAELIRAVVLASPVAKAAIGARLKAEIAALIAAYYRREIGRLMQQAEHWAANDKPFAVHHRVTKADNDYQVVALFERHGKFDQDVFELMRAELAGQDIKPPGTYPPSAAINRYRDPAFVAALATGEQPAPALTDVYVPGAWRCPKCSFVLQQASLNAADGTVTVRDAPGDACPNCNRPLWRLTWKEQANEMALRCEQLIDAARS
ncbi:hypothetical protein ACRAVF_33925 (plasmid) [Bradyrhizobium oligotrophicum S58]